VENSKYKVIVDLLIYFESQSTKKDFDANKEFLENSLNIALENGFKPAIGDDLYGNESYCGNSVFRIVEICFFDWGIAFYVAPPSLVRIGKFN